MENIFDLETRVQGNKHFRSIENTISKNIGNIEVAGSKYQDSMGYKSKGASVSVTNKAGTTRDSVNSYFKKYNQEFVLVDTAGIRKKSKVTEDLEYYSVIRSIGSIENSCFTITSTMIYFSNFF